MSFHLPKWQGEEDLVQDLLLHWWEQRDRYDATRDATIETFFRRVAKHFLVDRYRHITAEKRGGIQYQPVSLDQPVMDEEDEDAVLGDFVADGADIASEAILAASLARVLADLTPRQRALVDGLLKDFTVSDLSRRLHCRRSTLDDDLKRARRVFKDHGFGPKP